jgi:antitoxin (DNA-binding transcriptional repressor) of toxin-antitoxin stability system
MLSINIRQLRDTRRLKEWLRKGSTVELRERDRVIARIVPEKEQSKGPREWPNFAARSQELLKGRILPGADLVSEERGRF